MSDVMFGAHFGGLRGWTDLIALQRDLDGKKSDHCDHCFWFLQRDYTWMRGEGSLCSNGRFHMFKGIYGSSVCIWCCDTSPRISSNIISVLELIFLSGVDFFRLPTKAGIFDIVSVSMFPSFMQNIKGFMFFFFLWYCCNLHIFGAVWINSRMKQAIWRR